MRRFMRVAIIDMGTNTFHLLIASVNSNGYDILLRERKAVRIGEKGINKGEITPEAWDRAIATIKDYKQIIEDHQAERTFATATSAIRNASNGRALTRSIWEATGIETQIISGVREAELILLGVRKAMPLGEKKNLIMDIGGGSIEFIIANQTQTYWLQSFEIGGQRLVERFHKSDPISPSELSALDVYFEQELQPLQAACKAHQPDTLIGCSGTFDTLSDIYCEAYGTKRKPSDTEYPFSFDSFDEIYQQLITKTRSERLAIPGMIEMRVDMIVVACALIHYLTRSLQLSEIRVSSYALKEGILFEALDQINPVNIKK